MADPPPVDTRILTLAELPKLYGDDNRFGSGVDYTGSDLEFMVSHVKEVWRATAASVSDADTPHKNGWRWHTRVWLAVCRMADGQDRLIARALFLSTKAMHFHGPHDLAHGEQLWEQSWEESEWLRGEYLDRARQLQVYLEK